MPTDKQIGTVFNAGYTMQEHDPEMADKFMTMDENEIVQALMNGAKQFQKEKIAKQQQAVKERNQTKKKGR